MEKEVQMLHYSCACDVGLSRSENQDNFICNGIYLNRSQMNERISLAGTVDVETLPLFGVFDGMGGEECGEVAAYLAAVRAASFFPQELSTAALRQLCLLANEQICRYAEENGVFSMGTTAAMLAFSRTEAFLCNIGDSRIFVYDHRSIRQLSVDHLAPAPAGRKRPLSQNLGIPADFMLIDPYIARLSYQPTDLFLLCSDGLTDMVSLETIWRIVSQTEVSALADRLTEQAIRNGGKDNITVIAVQAE